jgi:hypothetical protein
VGSGTGSINKYHRSVFNFPSFSQVPNDMAFDNDYRRMPIAQNTQDFLSYNPFSEEQEEAPSATAVARPYRASSSDSLFKRHVRSRSKVHTYRDTSGGHLHPLRSAGLANGSGDAGITRPHLSRIVKVGTLVDVPPVQSTNTSKESSLSIKEEDVLVHEVCQALPVVFSFDLMLFRR